MKNKDISIISFSKFIPNRIFPIGRVSVKEVPVERIKEVWKEALFYRRIEEHFPYALFFKKVFKGKLGDGAEENLFKNDLHEATLSKGESLIVISGEYGKDGYKFSFKEYTVI